MVALLVKLAYEASRDFRPRSRTTDGEQVPLDGRSDTPEVSTPVMSLTSLAGIGNLRLRRLRFRRTRSTLERTAMTDSPAPTSTPSDFGDRLSGALAPLKPKLRGWLHAGTFPLATAAGIVLICLAPTGGARWAAAIFTASSMLLFGISAL